MTYGVADASYQAAGGQTGIQQLVADFYRIMDKDVAFQALRQMHRKELTESQDKLATFLCGWLGGPRTYRQKYGPISIPQVHQHLKITPVQKSLWLACMQKAITRQGYQQDFADYLMAQLAVPAERIVAAGATRRK